MKSRIFAVTTLAILALGSLNTLSMTSQAEAQRRYRNGDWGYRNAMVPAGTSIQVRLDSKISTEQARQGDTWTGTVAQSVYSGGQVVIPAGSAVQGVVTSAAQGTHSTPASIDLAVRRVNMNGGSRTLYADTEPIVAGSHRAKKIGAIAGGAAVGALVGSAVDKGKGTLIGGLLGGAAGYGLTRHALRTMQLKPGTVVSFTTREDVAFRR
jgi:hypothetical protein